MSIKIVIVDDDELICSSLKIILGMTNEMEVAATLSNGEEAFKYLVEARGVDVILMDIRMPICDGVLATKKIMAALPNSKIIMLTTFDDDRFIFEALKNGAKGYLLKNVTPDKLIEGIRVVHHGSLLLHPNDAAKVTDILSEKRSISFSEYRITESEMEIVRYIGDGLTNKEIAERVFLSEGTVKNKITEILDKLQLRDRTQIAIFYLKGGRL